MDDLKAAMRSGDEPRREAIRLLRAAIRNEEIERGHELGDVDVQQVITRQARRHRESIAEFSKAHRVELVEREETQLRAIEGYLPKLEPAESFEDLIRDAIREAGVNGPQAQGKVMGLLAPRLRGKTDMGAVGQIVRRLLQEGG